MNSYMPTFLFSKRLLVISLIALFYIFPNFVLASADLEPINEVVVSVANNQTEQINDVELSEEIPTLGPVYIFSSPSCPYCQTAKEFFINLQAEHNLEITVHDYELSRNIDLIQNFYQQYSVPANSQGLVPAIFFDDQYFIGFNDQIGQQITAYFLDQQTDFNDKTVRLPLLGETDLLQFSLPVLAITLGIVDGFNVCSLGALVLILGLVMVLPSRKRIFLLGGTFLVTTAIVYGILIFLWHQFFSLIAPYIRSLEMVIGILALAGGAYLLREFYKAYKSGPVCNTNNLISRLSPKLEHIFKKKRSIFLLMTAIISFAAVVTVIEFPCSAFLPVLFTSILVDAGLSMGTAVSYIGLYLLFYLLDELIIFIIAVYTLRIKIVSPKFITFFNLIAAAIFIFLGVYYLFGWLA